MAWRVPERVTKDPNYLEDENCCTLSSWGEKFFYRAIKKVREGVEYDIQYFHKHIGEKIEDVLTCNNINLTTWKNINTLYTVVDMAEKEVLAYLETATNVESYSNYPVIMVAWAGEGLYNAIKRLYEVYTDCGQYFIYKLPTIGSKDAHDALIDLGDEATEVDLAACNKFMEREELVNFKAILRRINARYNEATCG